MASRTSGAQAATPASISCGVTRIVWAVSSALREETEVDPRYGGWLNNDLADYVVAVNADIGEIEVGLLDRPDPLINALGAKGLGPR